MPKQLIFTSTPTGIQPGRSGFQVVAQHDDINNRLIQALEKESVYELADSSQSLPVVCKFLKFEFGDELYYVLTRMQSCGVDFTDRPNHIAHHLIFEENEIPECPPAAIFALWKGWRSKWDKPRYLGEWDRVNYENDAHPFNYSNFSLPAKTWYTYTGDEGCAALPLLANRDVVTFPTPPGKEDALLWLIFETQSLLKPKQAWKIYFTNFLTENDNPLRYNWIGIPESASVDQLTVDHEVVDVFANDSQLIVPANDLSEKARNAANPPKTVKKSAAVSIAPMEDDSDYVQDELGLDSSSSQTLKINKENSDDDSDEEDESYETLPDQHPDEDFGDIFKSEDTKIELPVVNMEEIDEAISEGKGLSRFLPFIVIVTLLTLAILAVFLTPNLINRVNTTLDPDPVEVQPTEEEKAKQARLEAANMDPESRFQNQLGEVDTIISKGQFLRARAYLSRYRGDSTRSKSEDYKKLDKWFEGQKSILELVNRKTGELESGVSEKKVLPSFENDIQFLKTQIGKLAEDLRPSLQKSIEELEREYSEWLSSVRLRTENAPTFFIPISVSDPNPTMLFESIPEKAKKWIAELEQFEDTAQIESIQIRAAAFLGLNQFNVFGDEAISLSIWRENNRSLTSYLDGQIEVVRINPEQNGTDNVGFEWNYGKVKGSLPPNANLPEPPLLINFKNTNTDKFMNVVVLGGVSQESAIPAEIPFDFAKFNTDNHEFQVVDPILKEKLNLFILPPNLFLKMRSTDNSFQFAWDRTTASFALYELDNLKTSGSRNVQQKISGYHKTLNRLTRQKENYESLEFIKTTPIWHLGRESIPDDSLSAELSNFGAFTAKQPRSYFEYVRQILLYYADRYTLVKPAVMAEWLEYPANYNVQSVGSVVTYRNQLVRTAKRFRSLLKKKDAGAVNNWKVFSAAMETWLTGEHEDKLLKVLSLQPKEILSTSTTNIASLNQEIENLETGISSLQENLESRSNVKEIEKVNEWVVEIASLDQNIPTIPLIIFR